MKYSILVVWNDGTEEYLKKGSEVARFKNWEEADKMKEFMLQGMSNEEYWKEGDVKACQLVDKILEGLYLPFGKGR